MKQLGFKRTLICLLLLFVVTSSSVLSAPPPQMSSLPTTSSLCKYTFTFESTLFVGCLGYGAYKSTDGVNFNKMTLPVADTQIAMYASNGNSFVIVSFLGQIYTYNGGTFTLRYSSGSGLNSSSTKLVYVPEIGKYKALVWDSASSLGSYTLTSTDGISWYDDGDKLTNVNGPGGYNNIYDLNKYKVKKSTAFNGKEFKIQDNGFAEGILYEPQKYVSVNHYERPWSDSFSCSDCSSMGGLRTAGWLKNTGEFNYMHLVNSYYGNLNFNLSVSGDYMFKVRVESDKYDSIPMETFYFFSFDATTKVFSNFYGNQISQAIPGQIGFGMTIGATVPEKYKYTFDMYLANSTPVINVIDLKEMTYSGLTGLAVPVNVGVTDEDGENLSIGFYLNGNHIYTLNSNNGSIYRRDMVVYLNVINSGYLNSVGDNQIVLGLSDGKTTVYSPAKIIRVNRSIPLGQITGRSWDSNGINVSVVIDGTYIAATTETRSYLTQLKSVLDANNIILNYITIPANKTFLETYLGNRVRVIYL